MNTIEKAITALSDRICFNHSIALLNVFVSKHKLSPRHGVSYFSMLGVTHAVAYTTS